MDGAVWIGIVVIIVVAVASVLAIVFLRITGKRLGAEPDGEEAKAEAERLKDQGRRDGGWMV
ncbi:flagellar basal body-associated protein FliL [Agromyces cerinus]|uniref:hypothetical protein n=1 Tax=Agromyces cerinus TaxID=33878 RepID=UPI0019561C68|nr:hypothetical protein [Agromyces cerinus]MBM7832718.1 flagellar basal body-associated protein FliL [Agromyces cerinus]